MIRTVFGNISQLGIPWINKKVIFYLIGGSYTSNAIYPDGDRSVVTDSQGNFTIDLWCNIDGLQYCEYTCTIGSYEFNFILPDGSVPISLSDLRKAAILPQNASNATQFTQLQNLPITTNGQIKFILSLIPARPDLSQVFLNGIKYKYGVDYNIDLAQSALNWFSSLYLETSDQLEIYY